MESSRERGGRSLGVSAIQRLEEIYSIRGMLLQMCANDSTNGV
jgi:hypothetical protein